MSTTRNLTRTPETLSLASIAPSRRRRNEEAATTGPTYLFVYSRISQNRRAKGGDTEGTDDQDERGKEYAERTFPGIPWEAFVDDDVSASIAGHDLRERPKYNRLMERLDELTRQGHRVAIIARDSSRVWRGLRQQTVVIDDTLTPRGVLLSWYGSRQTWDLATAAGREQAAQAGARAQRDSEEKREWVQDAMERNAREGRPHGGRAYGWDRCYDPRTRRPMDVPNDAEQAIIREVADRILAEESISAITADLNRRHVPTPTQSRQAARDLEIAQPGERGGKWTKVMVRHLVTRPRNAGRRMDLGEDAYPAAWEPVLDRDDLATVRRMLADPKRKAVTTGTGSKHLLSGVLTRCSLCDGPTAHKGRGKGEGKGNKPSPAVPVYRCNECGRLGRNAVDLDAYVTDRVLDRLTAPDALDLLSPRGHAHLDHAAKARDLEAELAQVEDDAQHKRVRREYLIAETARLLPLIEEEHEAARVVEGSPVVDRLLSADDVRAEWQFLTLDQQRTVIDSLVTVWLLPLGRGVKGFHPEGIRLDWKG